MGAIFDIIAIPLGWLLKLIYEWVSNYFVAIFLFTLLTRLLMFPLSLKSQKNQADRARLAPRLERLQKKYQKDPKKLQEKQMALYEKEGVSLTGGCMPMLVQMLVLFGIISVIYSPLKFLTDVPDAVVTSAVETVSYDDKKLEAADTSAEEKAALQARKDAGKYPSSKMTGYYKELRMLDNLEKFEDEVKTNIAALDGYDAAKAQAYYDEMVDIRSQFMFFGKSLLVDPFDGGFAGISLLWIIPIISGLTALASAIISMKYTKQAAPTEMQPGQGCSTNMMMYTMPLFSLFITFTVPGGVGVYWICSNLIATAQTVVLNHIYNPVKIREQAERDYLERRRQKEEDKKRLAEARAREQRALAQELNEQNKKKEGKKPPKKEPEEIALEQQAAAPSVDVEEKE